MKIEIQIGVRLKQRRLSKNLSQEKLAELSQLHRNYIGLVERGEKNITVANLQKILKALDITLQEFFDGI